MSNTNMSRLLILATLAVVLCNQMTFAAAEEEGIAVAIVYDTSGSMKESVRTARGGYEPKYKIANRALESIIQRIQTFATNSSGGTPRKIHSGLFVFSGRGAKEAVNFGPFDPAALRHWIKTYGGPDSSTPLGAALELASQTVLKSPLSRKHVVVVTDGINTTGPDPAAVMARIKAEGTRKNTSVAVHFVAFDVNAKIFDPVKKLGATVVGATDERQLNTQLEFIFEKKILLEDEEPKPANPKPN